MTLRILLCAEDVLCATIARDLCDRVVRERARAEWLRALWSPELCDTQRVWMGLRADGWWADRGAVESEMVRRGLRPHVRLRETGRLQSPKGKSAEAFRAMRVAASMAPSPDLVVIAGDTDGETAPESSRAAGVALADVALPVVIASICREAEAWVVAGFVPQNTAEHDRLRALRRTLGFDPTAEPERLMSDVLNDPRDAKRVVRALLTGGEALHPGDERVRACWLDTPIETLVARGERAGLADFVRDVERVLLPMLGDTPADAAQT